MDLNVADLPSIRKMLLETYLTKDTSLFKDRINEIKNYISEYYDYNFNI